MTVALRVIGVDPGLAKTGIAAVERTEDGRFVSRGVRLVETAPNTKRGQRVSADDERRIRAAFDEIRAAAAVFRPHALAVECYTVYGEKDTAKLKQVARDLVNFVGSIPSPTTLAEPANLMRLAKQTAALKGQLDEGSEVVGVRGRGKAAKTLAVYGAALTVAWSLDIPLFINMPVDIKIELCGRASASKQDVAAALRARVEGLEEQVLARVSATTKHEHVYDAAAHAVLGVKHLLGLGEAARMGGLR